MNTVDALLVVKPARFLLLTAFLSVFVSGNVHAEADPTKSALAKAQYMLRQVSTEKAELEKKLAEKQQENDALTKELAKAKNESKSKIDSSNAQQQEVLSTLSADRKKHEEKIRAESEKSSKLAGENENLLTKLDVYKHDFDVCYGNNKQLYEVNKEILGKYENKGFWAALSQKEPFTAIERVKVENLVQDYQYKIESLSVNLVSEGQK
jgi:DNA anti-recombination protein RmuC